MRPGMRGAGLRKVCERGSTWIKPSRLWMMYRCGRADHPGHRRGEPEQQL
ncbi:DUF4291 family protein [Streptomyces sp. NPDC059893]